MNITPCSFLEPGSAPITSSDINEERRLRRSKRSLSLKEQTKEVRRKSISSMPSEKKKIFTVDRHLKAKRLENIADLRNIHECLMKNLHTPEGKIVLHEDHLEFMIVKDQELSPRKKNLQKEQIAEFIYTRLLRAMTSQIYYFFDDAGYFGSLHSIEKMTKNRYGTAETSLAIETEKDLKYYPAVKLNLWGEGETEIGFLELLQNLGLPKAILRKSNEKEKLLISIFQRFYPIKNALNLKEGEVPQFAPITFLCTYEKLGLTTEEIFRGAAKCLTIKESYMPYLQKLRILNFLRLLLASHLRKDEKMTVSILESIETMRQFGEKMERTEFTDLIYEIDHLVEKRKIPVLIHLELLCATPHYDIGTLFSKELTGTKYTELLEGLSQDFKFLSARETSKVKPLSLLHDKGPNENALFYRGIINFIVTQFIQVFEMEIEKSSDIKHMRHKLNYFFNTFTDLAHLLFKKHDYISSFAIFNALSIFELSHFMLCEAYKGIFSKGKKTKLSSENKFDELERYFSAKYNFINLRKKMKECQNQHLFFVPFFPPILTKLNKIVECLDLQFADTPKEVINNEKLHQIAKKIWKINLMLQEMTLRFKEEPLSFHTNIEEYLNLPDYDEKKLTEIYEKLKIVLLNKIYFTSDTAL